MLSETTAERLRKMNSIKLLVIALFSTTLLVSCGSNNKNTPSLTEGVNITLRNTLQDPGETETSFPGLFGLPDNAFDESATLSYSSTEFTGALAQEGTPLGDISGLYGIDFNSDSITFTLLPDSTDPFWPKQFGVFPDGKFDRYYFTFSENHNVAGSTSNDDKVSLRIDSDKVLVVELSGGYDFNPGKTFKIDLESKK